MRFKLRQLFIFIFLFLTKNSLNAQPTINSFLPTFGNVGTLLKISGTNFNDLTNVTINGIPALIISSTNVQIIVSVMPNSTTGPISITTSNGNITSTLSFIVTPHQKNLTQQGNKLIGSGVVYYASQGHSVSISADGNTAIVGGVTDNYNQGAAWIFTRNNGTWSQQESKLVGSNSIGPAWQGYSVGISADGNTAIIGGSWDNSQIGAAWIFVRNNGIWTQQGSKLVPTSQPNNSTQHGTSVAISADGNTVIIGSTGAGAWIYTRNEGIWTQQSLLYGSDELGYAIQGSTVSLSADGNTAIISGPTDNSYKGAAWIFTRSNNIWTQQGSKLVGSGGIGNTFQGRAVSLSADGNMAIISSSSDNSFQGAFWIFKRTGESWTQVGNKLIGTGGVERPGFGSSASLSSDGNIALIAGSNDDRGRGAVWIFGFESGVWVQKGNKIVGSNASYNSNFGSSVSFSADGSTALVGGDFDNNGQGAVWVYSTCPSLLTLTNPNDNFSNKLDYIVASSINGKILASNQIINSSNIFYKAKVVELSPGFKVENGSVFNTEIGGCY